MKAGRRSFQKAAPYASRVNPCSERRLTALPAPFGNGELKCRWRFLITGSKRVEGFWLGDWAKKQRILSMLGLFKEVRALMREKVITTTVSNTYPIDRIREAVKQAVTPGKAGKVMLKFV